MSAFVGFVFSTSGVVVALLAGALWRSRRSKSGTGYPLAVCAISYCIASVSLVPQTVSRVLTSEFAPFKPADVPPGPTAVVVLGAGAETVTGWESRALAVFDVVGAARALEALRVFHLVNPAWVIASGGPSHSLGTTGGLTSGAAMRDTLVALGVPSSRVKIEVASRNTHDEAVIVTPMLKALSIQNVVLVTSDIHMRRAVATFRGQEWQVIPAIAPDPRARLPWFVRCLPTRHGLTFSGQVVHELLGIPYYWMRGWSR